VLRRLVYRILPVSKSCMSSLGSKRWPSLVRGNMSPPRTRFRNLPGRETFLITNTIFGWRTHGMRLRSTSVYVLLSERRKCLSHRAPQWLGKAAGKSEWNRNIVPPLSPPLLPPLLQSSLSHKHLRQYG